MIYFHFFGTFTGFRAQPVALTGFCRIVGDGLRSPSDLTDLGDSSKLILGSRSSSDKSIIFLYLLFCFKMSFARLYSCLAGRCCAVLQTFYKISCKCYFSQIHKKLRVAIMTAFIVFVSGTKNRRGHKLTLAKVMRKTLTPEFRMSTSHFMFSKPVPFRGVTRTF